MEIRAGLEGEHLAVQVTLKNEGTESLYLLNWTFDYFGLLELPEMNATLSKKTARPTRELAYACLGPRDELVLLNGFEPSFPRHLSPTQPRRPYATRLAAGETYRGTVRQKMPIREWHPYNGPSTAATSPARARTVRYRLEALRETSCLETPREHVNFQGAYIVNGRSKEVFEAIDRLDPPIEVLRRSDKFERFG